MSISFSGLASGLDTSSWVESLTALKRAKVETYQAEKENILLSQQTLASIKNFFNSFRSVIEKVTDTKFGVGSLDLFAQNLAISSKASVLTATANSEAQEGVYNIDISNLATNTQASSNYSQITTQTVTATATLGSTLSSLGVKAGNIGVTINGVERRIKIGNDETIQSFIEKLNNNGAQAAYNESTGIFNINLSTNDIRDIDNTGIINALHLKGVNEGYSGSFQTTIYETVFEKVTLDTELYKVGIQSDEIKIASNTNSTPMTLSIESTWTFNAFIGYLERYGFEAELTEDGCFTLKDAVIVDPGQTQILKAFGWDNPEVASSSQTSNKLQYTSTVVEGTVADRNTLLKDFADINNGDTIIVKNSSNATTTITLSQTSTIGDVLDKLNNAGLYANINPNGVVSISDGSIVGGSFDIAAAFNLTEQTNSSSATSNAIYIKKTIAQDVTSTTNVTYTGIRDAQLTDKVIDICPDFNGDIDICDSSGGVISGLLLDKNITFQELFDYIENENLGITMSMKDGIITINSTTGHYLTGQGVTCLGIGTNSTAASNTVTIATTRTSGTLYYTSTVTATLSDKVCDFVNLNETLGPDAIPCAAGVIYDRNGNTLDVIYASDTFNSSGNVFAATTFEDLKNKLAAQGITMTMNNGVISLSASNGAYVEGSLFEQLGIQKVESASSSSAKGLVVQGKQLTYMQGYERDWMKESDRLCDVWDFGDETQLRMTLHAFDYKTGKQLQDYYITVDAETTVSEFINILNANGIEARFEGEDEHSFNEIDKKYYAYGDGSIVTSDTLDAIGTATFYYIEVNLSSFNSGNVIQTNNAYNTLVTLNGTTVEINPINLNFDTINRSPIQEYAEEVCRGTTQLGQIIDPNYKHSTVKTYTVKLNNTETGEYERSIEIADATTMDNLVSQLTYYGVDIRFNNGAFYLDGTSGTTFISEMPEELAKVLGLEGKQLIENQTSYTNTNSNVIRKEVSGTIDGSQLINSAHTGTIQIYNNGKIESYTITNSMTYDEVVGDLINMGLNVSFNNNILIRGSSNVYVTDFGGAFGITGTGYTTSIQTSGTTSNTSSNKLQKEETLNANWDTTLGQINPNFNNGNFRIVDSNKNLVTVNIDKTDSLRDVREKLAMYNIAMDCSNGIITFSGTNGAYIKSVDSGNIFKLEATTPYKTTLTGITTEDININLMELYFYDSSNNRFEAYDWQSIQGNIYVYQNGVRHSISIGDDYEDLGGFINQLAKYGITATIGNDSKLHLTASGDTYLTIEGVQFLPSDYLDILGLNHESWSHNTSYKSDAPIDVANSSSQLTAAQRDTKLSDLGVTTGEYLLYQDGVRHTLYISSDDTLGDFLSSIRSFGIESSLVTDGNTTTIKTNANGNTYITASNSSDKSNVIEKLFGGTNIVQTNNYSGKAAIERVEPTIVDATEETKLKDLLSTSISASSSNYQLQINLNDENFTMNINPQDETVGDLINKIQSLGLDVNFANGQMVINSGYNSLQIIEPNSNNQLFSYSSDLGGYSATDPNTPITSTEVIIEENHASVANYADMNTKLGLLNISSGTLTIYRNGQKATINVDSEQTFGDLRSKISAQFSDVYLNFENGYLVIGSNNAEVLVGTTTDTSNFAAITGMRSDDNKNSSSSRALYRVNNDSKVTTSGLFVRGNVTEGNFKVGNATITIDKNTTLDDIISQINYSDDSNATAYWDSIDGKFVIKAKNTGASLINIEAGTSNFTNIMGLTYVEDGTNRMNISAQTLGQNARFTINGTNFTSTSNTVTSDVSRIQGVTLNLKDISNGETVTLTIEKDSESVANAMSDIVDAYNELIENVDKEVARGANLSSESTLKLIRNQIRSLMTASLTNSGVYKNLASIGISLTAASSGNIRTDNINQLSFDKDKFIEAFKGDTSSIKKLLVGTDDAKGILTQVEDVLEQALGGVTGYFASAEKSYSKKISKLDDKIDKANKAADRYKVRLEAKFKAMDMLISKFQNQYSSFLG